jgi:hypothetical protein
MWVFTRPRGGQDYYLLMCDNRPDQEFCPIHRFDGNDQISKPRHSRNGILFT